MMPIELQIRKARLMAGMSQQQLADAMGVARPVITRLESRGSNPKVSTLLSLSDILRVRFVIG